MAEICSAPTARIRGLVKTKARMSTLAIVKLLFILAFILGVNSGVADRVQLLVSQGRIEVIGVFVVVWAVALAATLVAAFEGRWWARTAWAALLSISGAVAWGYEAASGVEMTVFDAVTFWDARHEAGNAMVSYGGYLAPSIAVFAVAFLALAMPTGRMLPRQGLLWRLTPVLPALPILLISGVVYAKSGGGSQAMPKQFSQASLGLLLAYKTLFRPAYTREAPAWTADPVHAADKILILVDESIRPDYLNSLETPHFAAAAARMVNFGPAVSGGVCSNYSNAILRFAASREDIGGRINANPTLFRYAKAAGYRTVYIDAQAHTLKNTDLLQNFMTVAERSDIDGFYPLTEVAPQDADKELADIVARELAEHQRVFIFANKLGGHFPYDNDYPASEAYYQPTVTQQGAKTMASTVASYKNSVRWNVDAFFARLTKQLDFSNLALIYTSDHGQYLKPDSLTHCVSDGAKPQMGLVPLYAYSSNAAAFAELRAGAVKSENRASHFQIAPTVIAWMGYDKHSIESRYGESLTLGPKAAPSFTIGDVFGLFSADARWMEIDLSHNYRAAEDGKGRRRTLTASNDGSP